MQLQREADEVRELFRSLIQLHSKRGAVKVRPEQAQYALQLSLLDIFFGSQLCSQTQRKVAAWSTSHSSG